MAEPNVLFQVLPNGLTVILQEAHLAPVISLQVWAQVGSADVEQYYHQKFPSIYQ